MSKNTQKVLRIAINGFGRIGRNTLKAAIEKYSDKELTIVAINDLTNTKTLAHLLKYDTAYGIYEHSVDYTDKTLIVAGKEIHAYAIRDPKELPWKELDIDVVLECTGIFRTKEKAQAHIDAGAKLVIISAPSKGEGVATLVRGVSSKRKPDEKIVDNASCTTNCVAPVTQVVHNNFGIKKAFITTVHSYTADQKLQDGPHRDFRRARAAAQNIIPTSTGAALATTRAIPDLQGRFDGMAIRVPTLTVSLSDFTFLVEKKTTAEKVNQVFMKATSNPLYNGILTVTEEELVSSDYIRNPYSAIVDLNLTKVIDGDLVKVVAWYDNEWAYSCRLIELAMDVGREVTGE